MLRPEHLLHLCWTAHELSNFSSNLRRDASMRQERPWKGWEQGLDLWLQRGFIWLVSPAAAGEEPKDHSSSCCWVGSHCFTDCPVCIHMFLCTANIITKPLGQMLSIILVFMQCSLWHKCRIITIETVYNNQWIL